MDDKEEVECWHKSTKKRMSKHSCELANQTMWWEESSINLVSHSAFWDGPLQLLLHLTPTRWTRWEEWRMEDDRPYISPKAIGTPRIAQVAPCHRSTSWPVYTRPSNTRYKAVIGLARSRSTYTLAPTHTSMTSSSAPRTRSRPRYTRSPGSRASPGSGNSRQRGLTPCPSRLAIRRAPILGSSHRAPSRSCRGQWRNPGVNRARTGAYTCIFALRLSHHRRGGNPRYRCPRLGEPTGSL